MKFTIEVVRANEGGREEVMHSVAIDAISPRRAKTKADELVRTWRGRGASAALVFNNRREELYRSK